MAGLQPLAGARPPPPPPERRSFADILTSDTPETTAIKLPTVHRGEPALEFNDDEIKSLASPFKYALVGKFSRGRPAMEKLRQGMLAVGFKGGIQIGLLDYRNVLIRFDVEEDYVRCWLRGLWTIHGFAMRVFKWSTEFSLQYESPITPVWVNLPLLPIHFFAKGPLFSIGRLIGNPLKIDASTITLSRPGLARICVEIDVSRTLLKRFWIGNGSTGFWQTIEYEDLPLYCHHCSKLGHADSMCKILHPVQPIVQKVWKQKSEGAAVAKMDDQHQEGRIHQDLEAPQNKLLNATTSSSPPIVIAEISELAATTNPIDMEAEGEGFRHIEHDILHNADNGQNVEQRVQDGVFNLHDNTNSMNLDSLGQNDNTDSQNSDSLGHQIKLDSMAQHENSDFQKQIISYKESSPTSKIHTTEQRHNEQNRVDAGVDKEVFDAERLDIITGELGLEKGILISGLAEELDAEKFYVELDSAHIIGADPLMISDGAQEIIQGTLSTKQLKVVEGVRTRSKVRTSQTSPNLNF